MRVNNVLIIGASSFIGMSLVYYWENKYNITATYRTKPQGITPHIRYISLDVTNPEMVKDVISSSHFDIVLHLASRTGIEYCEKHKEEAYAITVEGTRTIAKNCAKRNIKLVFLSSDYVFDGARGRYTETDIPNPKTYHGLTKYLAEEIIKTLVPNYIICRTSGVYGYSPKPSSLIAWALKTLKKGEDIEVYTDIYNSPTYIDDLADNLEVLINKDTRGIYHICWDGEINRYEFLKKLSIAYGFNPEQIKGKQAAKEPDLSHRSQNTSLNPDKIKNESGLQCCSPDSGIRKMVALQKTPI